MNESADARGQICGKTAAGKVLRRKNTEKPRKKEYPEEGGEAPGLQ